MPEQTQFSFSHKEVVTALLKAQNIHEGIWGLQVKFGLRAMNVGGGDDDLHPTALIPVMAIQIQKADKLTNLSVNAAEVNPPLSLPFTDSAPKQIGTGKTRKAGTKKGRR